MRGLVFLSMAVFAVAPAASADRTKDVQALAAATAGRTQGEPVSCLQRSRSDNDFQAAGGHLIFRVSPRLTYVNELSPGCDVGGPRQAFVFRSPASRYCEGDIVESIDPMGGAAGGACSLGKFVPYTRP